MTNHVGEKAIKSQDGVAVVNHQDEDFIFVTVVLQAEDGHHVYSVVSLDRNKFQPY